MARRAKAQSGSEVALLTAARSIVFGALHRQGHDAIPLSAMAGFVNGTSYKSELVGSGPTPIIRISNMTDPSSVALLTSETVAPRFIAEPGDLLVSWSASFRTIIWPGPTGIVNQHIFRVRPFEDSGRDYLRHAIEYSFDDLRRHQVGIGMMHVRRGDFLGHLIPFADRSLQDEVAALLNWIELGRKSARPNTSASLADAIGEIDRLAALLDMLTEVRRRRASIRDGAVELAREMIRNGSPTSTPMSKLVTRRATDVTVFADGIYNFAGVYSFGRGVFKGATKSGSQFAYPSLSTIYKGDFTYPKLMAWEGALGIVPPECDGLVVSPEFPVFTVHADVVVPEVLDIHFRDPETWPQLSGTSTGTNVRRRRLNPRDFLAYEFPLPEREVQLRIKKVWDAVGGLDGLVLAADRDIDELISVAIDASLDSASASV